jgi:hypothetical protein
MSREDVFTLLGETRLYLDRMEDRLRNLRAMLPDECVVENVKIERGPFDFLLAYASDYAVDGVMADGGGGC